MINWFVPKKKKYRINFQLLFNVPAQCGYIYIWWMYLTRLSYHTISLLIFRIGFEYYTNSNNNPLRTYQTGSDALLLSKCFSIWNPSLKEMNLTSDENRYIWKGYTALIYTYISKRRVNCILQIIIKWYCVIQNKHFVSLKLNEFYNNSIWNDVNNNAWIVYNIYIV